MIDNQRIRTAIGEIVREVLRQPELDVAPDSRLREDLGLDSADIAELVVALEARLGVPLPDRLLEPTDTGDPLATVAALAATVASATTASTAPVSSTTASVNTPSEATASVNMPSVAVSSVNTASVTTASVNTVDSRAGG